MSITRRQDERLLDVWELTPSRDSSGMVENELDRDPKPRGACGPRRSPRAPTSSGRRSPRTRTQCGRMRLSMGGAFEARRSWQSTPGAGHIVFARSHERAGGHDVPDMNRAAIGQTPGPASVDGVGLPNPRGHRLAAFDGEEGFGHRGRNLLRVEGDDGTVAADGLERCERDSLLPESARDVRGQRRFSVMGAENRKNVAHAGRRSPRSDPSEATYAARVANGSTYRPFVRDTPPHRCWKGRCGRSPRLSGRCAYPLSRTRPVAVGGEALANDSCGAAPDLVVEHLATEFPLIPGWEPSTHRLYPQSIFRVQAQN